MNKGVIIIPVTVLVSVAAGAAVVLFATSPHDADHQEQPLKVDNSEVLSRLERLEKSMGGRLDELDGLLLGLETRVNDLSSKIEKAAKQPVAVAKAAKGGSDAEEPQTAPAPGGDLEEAVRKAMREEQAQQRERMFSGMQEWLKQRIDGRVQKMAEENGWDLAKEEQVKSILSDQMKKFGELARNMFSPDADRTKMREEFQKLAEETEQLLKDVLTDEEYEALRSSLRMRGPMRGLFPRGPGGGPPPGPGGGPGPGR